MDQPDSYESLDFTVNGKGLGNMGRVNTALCTKTFICQDGVYYGAYSFIHHSFHICHEVSVVVLRCDAMWTYR